MLSCHGTQYHAPGTWGAQCGRPVEGLALMRYVVLYGQQLLHSSLKTTIPTQTMKDWYASNVHPDLLNMYPCDSLGCDTYILKIPNL